MSRTAVRRLPSAVIAAALYAASALVLPVAHARTEVLRSTSEVEVQHTEQCPRIHTEATCLVCSTFQLRTPRPGALACAGPVWVGPTGDTRRMAPPTQDRPSHHRVRAPPAA